MGCFFPVPCRPRSLTAGEKHGMRAKRPSRECITSSCTSARVLRRVGVSHVGPGTAACLLGRASRPNASFKHRCFYRFNGLMPGRAVGWPLRVRDAVLNSYPVGRERRKSMGASGGQVRWKLWAVAVVWIITMIEVRHTGMDAGQIGRTADLHGFAARRVPDMDVPYASSVHGRQTSLYGKTCRKL